MILGIRKVQCANKLHYAKKNETLAAELLPSIMPDLRDKCLAVTSNRRESASGISEEEREFSGPPKSSATSLINDIDAASLSSSPSSMKIRLRNTFLEFKEEADHSLFEVDSPRADSLASDIGASSPLRRSQSDVTGVDVYIRQRLGSNAGVHADEIEVEGDIGFTPVGQISPMSRLATRRESRNDGAVSILSFSPPTFQQSPFTENRSSVTDFVMVMEEDPPAPAPKLRAAHAVFTEADSRVSTQPNTPSVEDSLKDERTTVMLRNIPNKYSQRMLLDEINNLGFEGLYDFFYLPIDYRNKCNVGYCFVSFIHNEAARRFMEKMIGYKLPGFNSQKICEVSWARVQGLKANIQHYRNSPVNSINIPEYRPLLFAHGTEIQFPFVNSNRMHR